MTISTRSLAFRALLALLLLVLVLLALPVAEWISAAEKSSLLGPIFSRKKMAAAVIGLVVLLVGGWLIWTRSFRLLTAGVFAAVAALAVLGVYGFQKLYPHAGPYSAERYKDSAAIVLGKDVLLSRFDPRPLIRQNNRAVDRAAFPVIDVHFHLESLPPDIDADMLVKAMDAAGVRQIVNLGGVEGGWERFTHMFVQLKEQFYDKYPDRFIMFVKPGTDALRTPDGMTRDMAWLKRAAAMGARGLKENKSFGMSQRDAEGKIVAIDDVRMDPVWELAAQLGWPVLIHTGEPPAFWEPIDIHNERFGELLRNPQWSLYGKAVPSREELMAQRERLIARHPNTNFIGAHLGMTPDDLPATAAMLDKYPNYYVDMSSVVSELGRQPFSTRRFFIQYQDRILFGSDGGFGQHPSTGWTTERTYRSYFEFMETDNEYIEYPKASITKQGNWRVYGLDLPPEVLEKIYYLNAQRLIPGEADVKARLAALD